MKNGIYLFSLLFLGLLACSEETNPKDIPFEMQPEGLQRAIETELLNNLQSDLQEQHLKTHLFLTNNQYAFMPCCCDYGSNKRFMVFRDSLSQIRIKDEAIELTNIPQQVSLFYLANASLTWEETNEYISDKNYKFSSFPFYSRETKTSILSEIEKNKKLLNEAHEAADLDYMIFYKERLEELKHKLKTVEALNLEELREIHPLAHIEIRDDISNQGLSPLTIEVLKGLIHARNEQTKKYLNVSYYHLYFQATRFNDKSAAQQMEAIDHLCPARIVDHSFAKSKGWLTDWSYEPVPVPEEITP